MLLAALVLRAVSRALPPLACCSAACSAFLESRASSY